MSRLLIFINGINAPVNKRNWVDRAANITRADYGIFAEQFKYYSRSLTRRFTLGRHVDDLQRLLQRYHAAGFQIGIVAHSNGAEIVSRAFRKAPTRVGVGYAAAEQVHLVAPACSDDWEENGFREALLAKQIGSITVHNARKDKAMALAKWSRRLTLGVAGFGTLGAKLSPVSFPPLTSLSLYAGGHSDMLGKRTLSRTLRNILKELDWVDPPSLGRRETPVLIEV